MKAEYNPKEVTRRLVQMGPFWAQDNAVTACQAKKAKTVSGRCNDSKERYDDSQNGKKAGWHYSHDIELLNHKI